MTKQFLIAIAIAGSLMGLTGCATEGYVDAQPADVVYAQPVSPGPDYVWVDGDWVWEGGNYNYHHGYWHKSRPGHTWVAGSWDHSSRGYRWNRGHWH